MGMIVDAFRTGGLMMWPILIALLAMLVASVRAGMRVAGSAGGEARAGWGRDFPAILGWGGLGLALGVLGTTVGISQAARAIELAGAVPPALAWSGIRVTLVTTIFGLVTFVLALISHFSLRWFAARRATG